MRVLIVDDNPDRHRVFAQVYRAEDVDHAFKFSQAVKFLNSKRYNIVQLDHDLGDFQEPEIESVGMYGGAFELTGYHVALHVVLDLPKEQWPDRVVIHSVNPTGAKSIANLLEKHGVPFIIQPFVLQEG